MLSYSSAGKLKDLARVPELGKVLSRPETRTGKRRALALIHSRKEPTYSSDPDQPNGVIQHLPGGRRVPGRFVNRVFVPKRKR